MLKKTNPAFATAVLTAAEILGSCIGAADWDAGERRAGAGGSTVFGSARRRGGVRSASGRDECAVAEQPPADVRAVVSFPHTPERCGYSIRAVSPSRPTATFHADRVGASPRVRNLHLTFAGDPSSSVVVSWSTGAETLASEVRFGTRPNALDRVVHGFSFLYPGAPGRRQHEVHLCGLEPGRTYFYDAGGAAARSQVYRFVTAPADASEVRVLVVGDSRTRHERWGSVARRALAEGVDVMVLSGDAVSHGSRQSDWDAFFGAAVDLLATTPGIWTHGNHEGLSDTYFAQFALPDNGTGHGVEQWYALTYGPVRFVVLNDTAGDADLVAGPELAFLRETLAAVDRRRTPFVVTSHHRPMYTTSSSHAPATRTRGLWAPLYDAAHVQVDLAGHVHSYESSRPLRGGTATSEGVVTDAAHGTRYFTFGGGGAPLYGFGPRRPSWLQTRESVRGYAIMTVSATRLRWEAHREDGSLIETVVVPP